jgi:hypothetical protein
MIIIGVDFHPEFQQVASVDTGTGEFQEKRLTHREEAENFYRTLAGMHAGSNDCWPSCSWSCGSEMPPRFAPGEYASRRRIGRMHD